MSKKKFLALAVFSALCTANTANSVPLPSNSFVHALWKMTGEYTRNGLLVSKKDVTVTAYTDAGKAKKL